MEQNKTRTYLLYAVGEIALVMIGILLALQVNNWNVERTELKSTINYLEKKQSHLKEDLEKLQILNDYRIELNEMCQRILDKGFDVVSDFERIELITVVTVERKFSSALKQDQRNDTPVYFKNIAGSGIEELQQDYLEVIDMIIFSEERLNTRSEELESDLWRSGFFTDNRSFFKGNDNLNASDFESGKLPPITIKPEHAMNSLLAIIHMNELSSLRLSNQYQQLMEINEELDDTIMKFINSNN